MDEIQAYLYAYNAWLAIKLRAQVKCNMKSLDCFRRSWHAVIPAVWDTLPASLLLQGHTAGWCSVMKAFQRCCY